MSVSVTFPEEHELIEFFGVMPQLLDASSPWFYNTLEFEVARDAFVVQCKLSPSYGDIGVRLLSGGLELSRFELKAFKSLRRYGTPTSDALIASFGEPPDGTVFGLMLQPRLWVGVGDFRTIPPTN
jgi:hypothetical protein